MWPWRGGWLGVANRARAPQPSLASLSLILGRRLLISQRLWNQALPRVGCHGHSSERYGRSCLARDTPRSTSELKERIICDDGQAGRRARRRAGAGPGASSGSHEPGLSMQRIASDNIIWTSTSSTTSDGTRVLLACSGGSARYRTQGQAAAGVSIPA